jgi:hypothetical protein
MEKERKGDRKPNWATPVVARRSADRNVRPPGIGGGATLNLRASGRLTGRISAIVLHTLLIPKCLWRRVSSRSARQIAAQRGGKSFPHVRCRHVERRRYQEGVSRTGRSLRSMAERQKCYRGKRRSHHATK